MEKRADQKTKGLTDVQKAALVKRQLKAQDHKFRSQGKTIEWSPRITSPYDLPIPGWNERRMTLRDFRLTCEREKIVLLQLPLPYRGLCLTCHDVPTIWIDSTLRGVERLQVAFHELGHYFMHKGLPLMLMSEKETDAVRDWYEVQADAVSIIALSPRPQLSKAMRKHANRVRKTQTNRSE
jgi:Zn-dependent peptidase ImmA (M78 family)